MKSGLSGGAPRALTMELLEDFAKKTFGPGPEATCGRTLERPHVVGPRFEVGETRYGLCVRCGMQVPISEWP